MQLLILLLLAAASMSAQNNAIAGPGRGSAPAPKNLKLMSPNSDMNFIMLNFDTSLGVQCTFCHVATDMASDANPNKEMARKMIAMVRQIDKSFPSSTGEFPIGYHEVDCMTCHRGKQKPETKAPTDYWNRNESLGLVNDEITPGVNLKVLPADTRVHGPGSIMHDFRDALHVDCYYCHGPNGWPADGHPRKDIARQMVVMVRQINTNFAGTGVFPVGPQEVTCFTCHRGSPHPDTLSNVGFGPPPAKKP